MYDTTDISYKTLKAYYDDDTTSLLKLNSLINYKKSNRPNWELWNSDVPLAKLEQLHVDEVYRFIFSVYDAPFYEAITVSKKDTTFKLQYLFYQHNKDSSKFDRIKEFEKSISKDQWNTLTEKITDADFWGLKNNKDYRGKDGNDLTVIGYYKNDYITRTQYVHRWTRTTLNDAFYFVYYTLLTKDERQFGK